MVVANVKALRSTFCQKGVLAAERAMDKIRHHAGEPSQLTHVCFYLWQAMDVCYHYAEAWQVVVDCALEAHEQMLRAGRWSRWKEFLEMALSSSRKLADQESEMTLLLYLGLMHERCGEWPSARRRLEKVVVLAEELDECSPCGQALAALANLERQAGQMDKAQQQVDRALEVLQGSDDVYGLSEAYRVLGNLYLQQGDNAHALVTYFDALKYAEASEDPGSQASIYHNLGTICAQQGDSGGAASYYHQALALFRQAQDRTGEALTLSNIGLACQADRGYWRRSVGTFRQAINLAESSGYFQAETGALGYLIDILLRLGQIERAAAAVGRLRALYDATNSAYGLATVAYNSGLVSLARGDVQTALDCLERALTSPEFVSDPGDLAQAETARGRALTALGRWQEAETAYKRALAQWSTIVEWPGELETWLGLVELYRRMGAWTEWETAWEQTRSLARRIEREDALAWLDGTLGDARFAAGRVQAGCDAYLSALGRLADAEENARSQRCYRQIVERAREHVALWQAEGRDEDAAALRAALERGGEAVAHNWESWNQAAE